MEQDIIYSELRGLREDLKERDRILGERLQSIDIKVGITNGRVTQNEKDILVMQTHRTQLLSVAGVILTIVLALIAYLK